jgi:hypothetical protein
MTHVSHLNLFCEINFFSLLGKTRVSIFIEKIDFCCVFVELKAAQLLAALPCNGSLDRLLVFSHVKFTLSTKVFLLAR